MGIWTDNAAVHGDAAVRAVDALGPARPACGKDIEASFVGVAPGPRDSATLNPDLVSCPMCLPYAMGTVPMLPVGEES
ncbi:MAG: hypothetical protein OXF93_23485 [Acidobacteria bacterium]|nr:hypothetical protein [Acidobacteriota bacterium]